MSFIKVDIAAFKAQWHDIVSANPELAEDEELRLDTLEGETEFNSIMARLVRRKLDAREMATGAKARKADVAERQARFEKQEETFDALIKSLLQAADLPKLVLPEATLSITQPRTRVNVIDVNELPQGFFERRAKAAEIKAALERGEQIPGAELALGDEGLMVRTK